MNKGIDQNALANFHKKAQGGNPVVRNAVMKNGIEKIALNQEALRAHQHSFSTEIKTGKATSQSMSGRCWMFAGLNLFRPQIIEKLNIKDFEFSQNYLMFYDKLEKANYFLDSILRTLNEEIYSRIMMWLLKDPLQDGGQWEMFTNLVNKYGAVPKYVMPETFHSGRSGAMNQLLTAKLRDYAAEIRQAHDKGMQHDQLLEKKQGMLAEFYELLTLFLGIPPTSFDFEYRDKDKAFHAVRDLSPKKFYEQYVGVDLNEYVSLINAPTEDKPYNRTYTVDFLGNVAEGKPVLYLNVESQVLKDACAQQLKDNEPVWFGCDVRLQCEKQIGTMATDVFLHEESLSTKFMLDKAGRLDYGESLLTHAMVFTGLNEVDGKPIRWKVENSWGENRGEKGYFVMSDEWFDEYNYQVVVHKKYLAPDMQKALEQEPVILPPWDPMGSLAKIR